MEIEFSRSFSQRMEKFQKQLLIYKQCVDITFADPKDVPEVNETNCFNSTDLSFNNVYSIGLDGSSSASRISSSILLPLAAAVIMALL
jgi:hypothetical protein